MANKNKDKGNRWELTVLASIKALFPDALTSRNDSRTEDANCVDFTKTGELAIQCKNYQTKPNFDEELGKMNTKKTRVLAFKWNKIRGKSGEFAVLRWEDFVKLLESTK